jgi:hypothetical protein
MDPMTLLRVLADGDVLVLDAEWRPRMLLGSLVQPTAEDTARVLSGNQKRRLVVVGEGMEWAPSMRTTIRLRSAALDSLFACLPSLFVSRVPQSEVCSCVVHVQADCSVACQEKSGDYVLPHRIAPGLYLGDGPSAMNLNLLGTLPSLPFSPLTASCSGFGDFQSCQRIKQGV